MLHYRLTTEKHTVNAKKIGDQWVAEIISHKNGPKSAPWDICYRNFPVVDRPDLGMLALTSALRREFGIEGTYSMEKINGETNE